MHTQPSDAAKLERCCRLIGLELEAAALQRRRLSTSEPEDEHFGLRWWVDLQFLILSLWRLRKATRLLRGTPYESEALRSALAAFDANTLSLRTMRNIGEHAEDYAIDSPKRHIKTIERRQLEVGSWDGQTFQWLQASDGTQHELNVDAALSAARDFQRVLGEIQTIAAMSTSPRANRR